jgi:hypothetical protein
MRGKRGSGAGGAEFADIGYSLGGIFFAARGRRLRLRQVFEGSGADLFRG